MKAPNLIALSAAVLFTTVSLAAMNSNRVPVPVSEINGVKVINLAPVNVSPTADDKRAALLTEADASVISSPLSRHVGGAAGLLGAQLAMPYYSFGNKFARISKE
jgi:hypothetical protein